jgi:hypothetical protein
MQVCVDQNVITSRGPAREIFGPNQILPFELLHIADRSQTLYYFSPNEARSVYSLMRLVYLLHVLAPWCQSSGSVLDKRNTGATR